MALHTFRDNYEDNYDFFLASYIYLVHSASGCYISETGYDDFS